MFYGQCPYMLENEHPSVSHYVHVAIFGSTIRLVTMVLCRHSPVMIMGIAMYGRIGRSCAVYYDFGSL